MPPGRSVDDTRQRPPERAQDGGPGEEREDRERRSHQEEPVAEVPEIARVVGLRDDDADQPALRVRDRPERHQPPRARDLDGAAHSGVQERRRDLGRGAGYGHAQVGGARELVRVVRVEARQEAPLVVAQEDLRRPARVDVLGSEARDRVDGAREQRRANHAKRLALSVLHGLLQREHDAPLRRGSRRVELRPREIAPDEAPAVLRLEGNLVGRVRRRVRRRPFLALEGDREQAGPGRTPPDLGDQLVPLASDASRPDVRGLVRRLPEHRRLPGETVRTRMGEGDVRERGVVEHLGEEPGLDGVRVVRANGVVADGAVDVVHGHHCHAELGVGSRLDARGHGLPPLRGASEDRALRGGKEREGGRTADEREPQRRQDEQTGEGQAGRGGTVSRLRARRVPRRRARHRASRRR